MALVGMNEGLTIKQWERGEGGWVTTCRSVTSFLAQVLPTPGIAPSRSEDDSWLYRCMTCVLLTAEVYAKMLLQVAVSSMIYDARFLPSPPHPHTSFYYP